MDMNSKNACRWKRMANHPPAINRFEPILLSQIYWDFLFVSYSPSFFSNKIFPIDWLMSLHFGPSHKCSLFHHFYLVASAMHNDEVNRLFLVVRLDLIWGHKFPEHSWTFSGTSCLHDYDFPFLVRKGNYWAVRNHCWKWLSETSNALIFTGAPWIAALCSGVQPSSVRAMTSAPAARRACNSASDAVFN